MPFISLRAEFITTYLSFYPSNARAHRRGYNVQVPDADKPGSRPPIDRRTIGLILIAVMIVLYTIVRWGRHIPWSAR